MSEDEPADGGPASPDPAAPVDPPFAVYTDPAPGEEPGTWRIDVSPAWLQGRTLFGGAAYAAAAGAMRAALRDVAPDGEGPQLRALTYAFIGPIVEGPAIVRARVDRRGKSISFCSALVEQDGQVCARATAAYGDDRESDLAKSPDFREPSKALDDCFEMPYMPGITPECTRDFDFRWASALPFSGSDAAEVEGYIRYRSAVAGEGAVIALMDAWPPVVYPMASGLTPASSVSMSIDLLRDCRDVDGQRWFTFTGAADAVGGGFEVESGILAQDGVPLALVRQVIATYQPRTP